MTAYISLTGKEWLRKKVLIAAFVLTALFLALYGYGVREISSQIGQNPSNLMDNFIGRFMMLYLGLFFAQFVAAFVVLFACMGTLSGERESGLLLAILARPQPRWRIYTAKWIGHAVWLTLYNTVIFLSIVLIMKGFANYPFEAVPLLKTWALFCWIPLLLLTVTMLGSVYLPTLGNGIFSALLYGIALFSGFLQGVKAGGAHPSLEKFTMLAGLIMPTDLLFKRSIYELIGGSSIPFLSTAQLGPFSLPSIPSNAFLWYTVVYGLVVLLLGFRAFSRKDI
jgi:ABC-type transport system involved in multi-copper enzyme maturation permease subunit